MKYVLTFAFLILVVMVSGCETLQEIDKGLYQFSDEVAPQDRITGARTLNLKNRKEEIAEGNKIVEHLISELNSKNILINEAINTAEFITLTNILNKIISVSHFPTEKWKILYIPELSFNAYVTGGTYVVVHKGLMDVLKNDDEIAAVIGHEIGHVAAGHISEKQAHKLIMGLARKKSVSQEGYNEAFTNINEQEADKIGVLYASLAGFNPFSASDIWKKMTNQRENKWQYFRSHPTDSDRATQTHEYATNVMSYYSPGRRNDNHVAILACNKLWCRESNSVAAGEGGGFLAVLNATLKAMIDNLNAEVERLRQQDEMQNQ